MQRCSVSAFILFQKMANSPGSLFIVDKNCNGEETRRTVQKLKRKLTSIHVTQKSAAKPEENTATAVKLKRMCKNYVEETVLENKSEDRSCDTVDLQDNILEREMQKKWKGSRSKRKLNSRLSRIPKGKSSQVDNLRNSIDCYDTDSRSSADSGIECKNYVTTQNVGTSATSRKTNIVAMDCEFVGVGPLSKNALGEVIRFVKDFTWFVVAKNHKYLIHPLYLQVDEYYRLRWKFIVRYLCQTRGCNN